MNPARSPARMTVKVSQGSPESFGWLRRPDLDTLDGQAWELPDGSCEMFPKGCRVTLARIPPFEIPPYGEAGDELP